MYGAVTVSAEDCEVLFGIELYRLTFAFAPVTALALDTEHAGRCRR